MEIQSIAQQQKNNIIQLKNYFPIYLYGLITIIAGIFLCFASYSSFEHIKLTLGVTLSLGALVAFVSAFSRLKKQVQFTYHEIHALTLLAYGISIIYYCDNMERLITLTTFYLIIYAISEIIFCNWLFNLGRNIIYRILTIRIIIGLMVGIGTVVVMSYTKYTIETFGALFILIGINILFYVPIMKSKEDLKSNIEIIT